MIPESPMLSTVCIEIPKILVDSLLIAQRFTNTEQVDEV
jgi:hypothetical protein